MSDSERIVDGETNNMVTTFKQFLKEKITESMHTINVYKAVIEIDKIKLEEARNTFKILTEQLKKEFPND